ncbi:MAG: cupin domain-containing protein [Pseudomonadales bacterium]|nr:cupin domain-containing protein [Pseudomonadales bacterium]
MRNLLLMLLLSGSINTGLAQTDALAINLGELEWGPPGGGNGVPPGTRTARQGIDPDTGGITYFAHFPAGTRFDRHWHTHDEFVSVQQGSVRIILGEQSYALEAGAYVVIPGGMEHVWEIPENSDVVILVRRAGPADFHFVE